MDSDTAVMHEVTTGIQDDEFIEIIDGIDDSMEVISGPYSVVSRKLESGTIVRIKEEKDDDKKSD